MRLFAERLGGKSWDVKPAMEAGLKAQANFNARLKERGQRALAELGSDGRAMVVVSRPYNGADTGINLGLPAKMRAQGVVTLPLDMPDLDAQIGPPRASLDVLGATARRF